MKVAISRIANILAMMSVAAIFFFISTGYTPSAAVGWILLIFVAIGSGGNDTVSSRYLSGKQLGGRWSYFSNIHIQ